MWMIWIIIKITFNKQWYLLNKWNKIVSATESLNQQINWQIMKHFVFEDDPTRVQLDCSVVDVGATTSES